MSRWFCMLVLASVVTLTGCGSNTSNPASAQIISSPLPSGNPSPAPPQMEARAIGKMDTGEILIFPKVKETVAQLGAPSCAGGAEDYSIKSEYEALFKDNTGQQTFIPLPEFDTFITPENTQISLPTLHFKDFQAVVLAPQYTDCHGVTFYLIGAKDNAAFYFKFKTDEGTYDSFNYAPDTTLKVVDDQLVVESGQAAGSETPKQWIFKPDLHSQTMQWVKS